MSAPRGPPPSPATAPPPRSIWDRDHTAECGLRAAEGKGAFAQIGDRIVGYTRRYYLLSYCSPARAGKHVVTIEAHAEDASGQLRYEFDAKGFEPLTRGVQPRASWAAAW